MQDKTQHANVSPHNNRTVRCSAPVKERFENQAYFYLNIFYVHRQRLFVTLMLKCTMRIALCIQKYIEEGTIDGPIAE